MYDEKKQGIIKKTIESIEKSLDSVILTIRIILGGILWHLLWLFRMIQDQSRRY